jgi:hypothetical protein
VLNLVQNRVGDVLVGSDPEVFVMRDGHYVSAIGKFPGTKHAPVPVPRLGKGFFQQVDNVLLEYNIPACVHRDIWTGAHNKMLNHLSGKAGELGMTISIDASGELPDEELIDPASRVFGCDPDFDAWNLRVNPSPKSTNPNLRSAGGHIHLGFQGSDLEKVNIVRYMDLTLGAWATMEDADVKRKELYGRPGAMRFKDYGLEYRTVSNFWLKSEKSMQIAFDLAVDAVSCGLDAITQPFQDRVEAMFRNNDKDIAYSLLQEFGIDHIL